jgi:chromosome condensin MukBEF MukE localization factor
VIKAYVVGISTHYEGEDIEIRYSIYNGQELLLKKSFLKGYKKPSVVSHEALLSLLKELNKFKGDETVILINDASLQQQIRGISQTKKTDVLRMAERVRAELNKFGDSVTVEDVSNDSVKLKEWNDVLRLSI